MKRSGENTISSPQKMSQKSQGGESSGGSQKSRLEVQNEGRNKKTVDTSIKEETMLGGENEQTQEPSITRESETAAIPTPNDAGEIQEIGTKQLPENPVPEKGNFQTPGSDCRSEILRSWNSCLVLL